jgi:hypothetical protein
MKAKSMGARGLIGLGSALLVVGCAAPSSDAGSAAQKVEGAVTYTFTGVSDQGTDKACTLTLETSDGTTVTQVSLDTYVASHSFEIGDFTKFQTGKIMPQDVPQAANDAETGQGPELDGGAIHQTPFVVSTTFPFFSSGVTLSTKVEGFNRGPLFERLLSVSQVETLKIKGSVDDVQSFTYDAEIKLFPLGLVKVDSASASCHDMMRVAP